MEHFYVDLADGCVKWYSAASNKYAQDAQDITPFIEKVLKHKHLIMNYSNENFHIVKNELFRLTDTALDSFMTIGSLDEYLESSIKRMEKKVDNPKWKIQLKYSTQITKRCASDQAEVAAYEPKIVEARDVIAKTMTSVT